eukprot:SAG31_NODE_5346_length_2594_cov_6.626052_4_plen_95_part_00
MFFVAKATVELMRGAVLVRAPADPGRRINASGRAHQHHQVVEFIGNVIQSPIRATKFSICIPGYGAAIKRCDTSTENLNLLHLLLDITKFSEAT